MPDDPIRAALEAAAKIRDHIANQTPARCDPTFMDADDQWWQVRYWPDFGVTRHDTGPHGKHSKVQHARHWAHDLLPGTYDTLSALLAALDAAAVERAAEARDG
jgi:hypothetical protein